MIEQGKKSMIKAKIKSPNGIFEIWKNLLWPKHALISRIISLYTQPFIYLYCLY